MASAEASTSAKGSVKNAAMAVLRIVTIFWALVNAYKIRLHAVEVYGRVIHEFDPWFNFRATQYLVDHGWRKFFTWYDHESWYPLGRPVGTTIYPGMQFTAAGIFRALDALGFDVSLNDVCVFIPAGFAVIATLFTALIAREAAVGKHKATAFAVTAAVMAILPAHITRSVAGGFDNESVAVTAIVATFFWWIRSLRTEQSWPFAFAAALSYGYMVAAWGGYTFVLNMVGVHAAALFLAGRFTWNLYKAYSVFYLVGTGLAVHVPVVGWTPLRSMEQMGPLFVLGLAQLAAVVHVQKRRLGERDYAAFRKRAALLGAVAALAALVALDASGLVGGLSARVRGLFVPHTHTGNPLVDSVAEHQATRGDVYWQYFDAVILFAPAGAVSCAAFQPTPARTFVALYFLIAGYFSTKMVRLVLLLGPASAVAAGVALGAVADWVAGEAASLAEVTDEGLGSASTRGDAGAKQKETTTPVGGGKGNGKGGGAPGSGGGRAERRAANAKKKKSGGASGEFRIDEAPRLAREYFAANASLRKSIAAATLAFLVTAGRSFVSRSRVMAQQMSEPSIMVRGYAPGGGATILDDFRESYWWLRDNTPEDARVMAWWDYGYQIAGVANRTTLADGNTWNHEHIALLGKCLVSPEEVGHPIVRQLADYVLVWTTRYAGMPGDDLAKSPHMARIAGSVYDDVKQEGFYVDERGNPSASMRESLLFKLSAAGMQPDVEAPERYEEAYASKNRMVRIWKVLDVDEETKRATNAGEHKVCDAGGWYCPGQYPEKLREVLSAKRDFQLEH